MINLIPQLWKSNQQQLQSFLLEYEEMISQGQTLSFFSVWTLHWSKCASVEEWGQRQIQTRTLRAGTSRRFLWRWRELRWLWRADSTQTGTWSCSSEARGATPECWRGSLAAACAEAATPGRRTWRRRRRWGGSWAGSASLRSRRQPGAGGHWRLQQPENGIHYFNKEENLTLRLQMTPNLPGVQLFIIV